MFSGNGRNNSIYCQVTFCNSTDFFLRENCIYFNIMKITVQKIISFDSKKKIKKNPLLSIHIYIHDKRMYIFFIIIIMDGRGRRSDFNFIFNLCFVFAHYLPQYILHRER